MRLRKKPWIEKAMVELIGDYVLMHDLEQYKGKWQELFPGKKLCLEIGCGKGPCQMEGTSMLKAQRS